MDAKIHNECERKFLSALENLKNYTGDFNIDVAVPNEGGFIDEFIINILDIKVSNAVQIILSAFITFYFTKKINVRDDILKGIDIMEKIKNGSLTEDEAMTLVAKDKKLKKLISDYYKTAEKDSQLKSVEVSAEKGNTSIASSNIRRENFQTHIIETDCTESTRTIEGATISILSPVLQKGHGKIWDGIYSGKTIQFKITDKEFLKQVYDNDIKFGSATTIKCSLQITTRQIIEDDNTVKEEDTYLVKYVQAWSDDQHYQNETKRYRKQKTDDRQLSLDF